MTPPPDHLSEPLDHLSDRLSGLMIRDRHRLGRRIDGLPRYRGDRAARERAAIARSVDRAERLVARRQSAVPVPSYPVELPVSERREDIMAAIAAHQVVVVAGETGSGKTTQIPKMCLELGRGVAGMIGHTQPRRIAARTVAERVAEELSVEVGTAVGYAVRFSDSTGDQTLLKVMTDGILLAEIRHDRLLTAYDTIIVDEAHERSLNIDFLLGYLTHLLPERPDLKLIVTSATIDTARFAAHFDAPVVEVTGRTYPVEIRYRPLLPDEAGSDLDHGDPVGVGGEEGERDTNQAICEAVSELVAEGPGDVLVFLPGERDIRDAADALESDGPDGIEILPLYARLSTAEQHRAFRPHRARRVVLATNVAETSLTVPGIRYVVDTGLARISRFNPRSKVQRLPIEAVSRASADQRSGRCGRVAPGICIRLYSESDYVSRAEYSEPEILRTNLASVILQMASIGLGEVEDFPFIEPPDRRSIADGRALLEELGAFDRQDGRTAITALGRRLARLPVDPRLGRMVLAAEERDCLREVTVIAAALSIQDPRERPVEKAQAAAEAHRRFEVEGSDFLAYTKLWDYLAELQTRTSRNQFRRQCRAEYLHVLRVREWQDVAGQIREVYRSEGMHANREPASPDQVHQALLTGLLSHVGSRDRIRGDYQGARNTRWLIGRESSLARRQPAWVMAGSLIETQRTWARTVARIEPAWAEQAGAHLLRHSYSDEWWDAKRGEAMTEHRATLYGLPVAAPRGISLARVEPAAARQMFIQRALVERDWVSDLPPLAVTADRIRQVRTLEERVRRSDLLVGDEVLYAYFEACLPADITSGRRLERWWRRTRGQGSDPLEVPLEVLVHRRSGPVRLADYPDTWVQDGMRFPLRYRYEPGAPDDGVTVVVPLSALSRVRDDSFEWNIPGFRPAVIAALVRTLPKTTRRALGPVPEVVEDVLDEVKPNSGPFLEVVARRLAVLSGEPVWPASWDWDHLSGYLRVLVEVVDATGAVMASGRDLRRLKAQLGEEIRNAVRRLAPEMHRHGAQTWDFGDIAPVVQSGYLRGYPALVDEGDSVGLTVLESQPAQAVSMWAATVRLIRLAAPLPGNHLQRRLTNETKLALARSDSSVSALLEDCAAAVAEQILEMHGGPTFSERGFVAMADEAEATMTDRVARLATVAGGVLAAAKQVESRLAGLRARYPSGPVWRAAADVETQVESLVGPGFVSRAGSARLGDLLRYMEAALRRVDRLPGDIRRDEERREVVQQLQARYEMLLDRVVAGTAAPGTTAGLAAVPWMIEELRVSLWAQDLGTPGPVSSPRILRVMDQIEAAGWGGG